MRRLFGGGARHPSKSASLREEANGGSTGQKATTTAGGGGAKTRKSVGFPSFLRKSQSTQERRPGCANNDADDGTQQRHGTQQQQQLLGPSRTFDGTGSINVGATAGSASYSTDGPILCDVSDLADGDLDRQLMQTCTDVKYVNRRPGKCSAVVDANFQRQCLQAHNYVRQVYSSPPLLWSQELAALAKTWALKLADRGRVLYPELPGIGENIFLLTGDDKCISNTITITNGGGTSPALARRADTAAALSCPPIGDHLTTGIELVAHWATEAHNVDFERPRWSNETKHFTQMVWRSAMEMGVARHWNTAKNCLAIVAFYRPAGNSNLPGEFSTNLPSVAEATDDALHAVTLAALIQALNRNDLGDGGFRKGGPLPPVARPFVGPPNTTKILKSSVNGSGADSQRIDSSSSSGSNIGGGTNRSG